MNITIRREVAEKIGYKALDPYIPVSKWSGYGGESNDIDLTKLKAKELDSLYNLLNSHRTTHRAAGIFANDIASWRAAAKGSAAKAKSRTISQFSDMLTMYLLTVPGHRLYKRRETSGTLLAYYVTKVELKTPRESAPYTQMHLSYEDMGERHNTSVTWEGSEVNGRPVFECLGDTGFLPETPERRLEYLENLAKYREWVEPLGKQFLATGFAQPLDQYSGWNRAFRLDSLDGTPGKVVMDVLREDSGDGSGRRRNSGALDDADRWFWRKAAAKFKAASSNEDGEEWEDDSDDLPLDPNIDGADAAQEALEVPIHPHLAVFHLTKHRRAKVHVGQLVPYEYDVHMAEKLVLPDDQKALIRLLVNTKGGAFKDIVQGKGGGAVVLLSGPPGTGKTLTAEVYAESTQRPLYSVQCSQLGTSPEKLEENVLAVFARAARWDAVVLLDEADVYVQKRGGDMKQNAIVGVFLRVLEYQGSVLFLTTNRPDDVDDAIASRCIAKLPYAPPDRENALRIWSVLTQTAGIVMEPSAIEQVVSTFPHLSGRDVKNLLKLASVLAEGAPLALEHITTAHRFKPTD